MTEQTSAILINILLAIFTAAASFFGPWFADQGRSRRYRSNPGSEAQNGLYLHPVKHFPVAVATLLLLEIAISCALAAAHIIGMVYLVHGSAGSIDYNAIGRIDDTLVHRDTYAFEFFDFLVSCLLFPAVVIFSMFYSHRIRKAPFLWLFGALLVARMLPFVIERASSHSPWWVTLVGTEIVALAVLVIALTWETAGRTNETYVVSQRFSALPEGSDKNTMLELTRSELGRGLV